MSYNKAVELNDEELNQVTGGANEEHTIMITGTVTQVLNNGQYIVLYSNREITCHIPGEMRKNGITVGVNDEVVVQLSPYDVTRGRIVSKNK